VKRLHKKLGLLFLALVFSSNLYAGPVVGGGGALTDIDGEIRVIDNPLLWGDIRDITKDRITVKIDSISDFKLKNDDVVDFGQIVEKYRDSLIFSEKGQVQIDFSANSDIEDVQLNSGFVIDNSFLKNVEQIRRVESIQNYMSGPGLGGGSFATQGF